MKKPWIYDCNLPATLAEELRAEGFARPSSPGIRTSFEEKQKALEMHSLQASGDLVLGREYEWTRMSAARASQHRARMRKLQTKGRRSASACLGEAARRELGLSEDWAFPGLDKTGEDKGRETPRRFSYPTTQFLNLWEKKEDPEPVVINTVDDLLRHLEKMGRLQPTSVCVSNASPAPSVTGSETEAEPGDTSFESVSSTESESEVSDSEAIVVETPNNHPRSDVIRA